MSEGGIVQSKRCEDCGSIATMTTIIDGQETQLCEPCSGWWLNLAPQGEFLGKTAQEWHDIALDWKRKAKQWEIDAKTAQRETGEVIEEGS